jgi:hypothetical protein
VAACSADPLRAVEQKSIPTNLHAETIVELPLSAVPAPADRSVLAPRFPSPGGAQLQVLRVLEEPRQIPLDHYLTYRLPSGEIVSHPFENEILNALAGELPEALAVYVHVEAPADTPVADPLNREFGPSAEGLTAWPPLTVAGGESGVHLPCAPPTDPSDNSARISPPEPAYPAAENSLSPGEVREGWLLCLSTAEHSGSATLEWVFSGEAEVTSTAPAWTPLARLPVGAWHLIEEGTVIGWNAAEQADDSVEPPAPPSSRFPTATSVVPESGAEVVYQGPLWVSIGTGFSYLGDSASAGDFLGSLIHAQRAPGDCPGVSVWYRDRGVDCSPAENDRVGRLALQFMFPDFEEAQAEWDSLALDGRLALDLYVQDSLDGLFGTVEGIEVQSRGTWVQADLPGESPMIWAALTLDESARAAARTPVWEIPLYDAAFGQVNTREGICLLQDCLDPASLALAPSARADLQLEMPIPLLTMRESGHGVTPRLVRRILREILVNDNLHGQDFLPREQSDPWLLIDIATVNDRAQRSFLVYPDGAGGYETEPLEMVHYYEESSGPLVVRYDAHAETRRGDEGFALLGTLPADVPLDEAFLVMANTGPAWRLK